MNQFDAGWRDVPVFGSRSPSAHYTLRPSAYVLVADARGQLGLVRTPQGVFLPGGGIHAGESPAQAAERETLEECGLVVHAGQWTTRAIQLAYSESEQTNFEKQCTFIDAILEATASSGGEADHELLWLAPAAASAMLTPDSHVWAVDAWAIRIG